MKNPRFSPFPPMDACLLLFSIALRDESLDRNRNPGVDRPLRGGRHELLHQLFRQIDAFDDQLVMDAENHAMAGGFETGDGFDEELAGQRADDILREQPLPGTVSAVRVPWLCPPEPSRLRATSGEWP